MRTVTAKRRPQPSRKLATAAQARAEGCGVTGPVVHIDRTLVAAVLARHEQATNAVPAHAAECHRADWFVVPGQTFQAKNTQGNEGKTRLGSSRARAT